MDFKINQLEREHLYGLPHLQQLVYYAGIRPYMDYATGFVGIKRGISYQSLREEIYVQPHTGYKAQAFSRDQIIRAVDGLERAGLIQNHTLGKALVLKCLLASHDNSVQNKAATKPLGQATIKPSHQMPVNSGIVEEFSKKAVIGKPIKAATPPESGFNNNSHSNGRMRLGISFEFHPSEGLIEKALAMGCETVNCTEELMRFILYHQSKGTMSCDWDAEYLRWLLNGKRYQQKETAHANRNSHKPAHTSTSLISRVEAANLKVIRNE